MNGSFSFCGTFNQTRCIEHQGRTRTTDCLAHQFSVCWIRVMWNDVVLDVDRCDFASLQLNWVICHPYLVGKKAKVFFQVVDLSLSSKFQSTSRELVEYLTFLWGRSILRAQPKLVNNFVSSTLRLEITEILFRPAVYPNGARKFLELCSWRQ